MVMAPWPVSSAPAAVASGVTMAETRVESVLGNGRRVVAPVSVDPVALGRLPPVVEGA